MRKSSETVNHEAAVKVEKYDIQWPELLAIEPTMKIEVSPTRSAYIYEDPNHKTVVDHEGGVVTQSGYRVMFVVTKTGLPPIRKESYYPSTNYGRFFDNLLDVRYHLIEYSQANRPRVVTQNQKIKTVVGTEEYEDVE